MPRVGLVGIALEHRASDLAGHLADGADRGVGLDVGLLKHGRARADVGGPCDDRAGTNRRVLFDHDRAGGRVEDHARHDECFGGDRHALGADDGGAHGGGVDLGHALGDDLEIELERRVAELAPVPRAAQQVLALDGDGLKIGLIAHEHVADARSAQAQGDHVGGVLLDEHLTDGQVHNRTHGQWAAGVDQQDFVVALFGRGVDGDARELSRQLGHVGGHDDADGLEIERDRETLGDRQGSGADRQRGAEIIERRERALGVVEEDCFGLGHGGGW